MWSYYGSKSKIVHLYQPPKYGKIIEPFAGSAKYALRYWDREVLLVDKYDVIVRLWNWLKIASAKDILGLPRLKEGQRVSDFQYDCEEQKILMGFLACQSTVSPQDKATFRSTAHRPKWFDYSIQRISQDIEKIRHWEIRQGDYADIANQEATWFIDPPYTEGGQYYKHSSKDIDYKALAEWCNARHGQAIVCENGAADWLPFSPLRQMRGSRYTKTEVVWYNLPIAPGAMF